MLTNLHVKNLALIKEEEIDFKEGLNILSGETGAGKSIIIGSINIALGEKASKEFIRKDADFSLVELIFKDDREVVKDKLRENDIEVQEDDTIIISRKITHTSSSCKVNGETVTLAVLKSITALLVDIHGQHEHQSLLNKNKHLEILDEFSSNEGILEVKSELLNEYKNNTEIKEKLAALNIDEEELNRNISFYEFEINEIDEAALIPNEDVELEEKFKKMSQAEKITASLYKVYNNLSYDDGAGDLISNALGEMSKLPYSDDELSEITSTITDLESICKDLTSTIHAYIEDNAFDEEKFNEIGERLNTINHLKSKYGNSIEKILAYRDDKEALVNDLRNNEALKNDFEHKLNLSNDKLNAICKKLTSIRKKCAKNLEASIINHLKDLNFLDVRFNISIESLSQITKNGSDSVEFMISTNPGEPIMPLSKIASGGELSRVMLAIKTVLANTDEVDTLIFDEIDAGISGQTAWSVSKKLNIISRNRQVICISHLPQIAAMADNHYLIEKSAENNTTKTAISLLSKEEEINELARMLGGGENTPAVIANAKELKTKAFDIKLT